MRAHAGACVHARMDARARARRRVPRARATTTMMTMMTPATTFVTTTNATTNDRCRLRTIVDKRRARASGDRGRATAFATTTARRGRASARAKSASLDALGVSAETWESVEGALFALSLAPYVCFLSFLSDETSACPRGALFGFKFLLAFVFGTIPFAIVAKVEYGEILANCDALHGAAESLLTLTNVFIVLGFRRGVREARRGSEDDDEGGDGGRRMKTSLGDIGAALFCTLVVSSALFGGASEVLASNPDVAAAWDSRWPRVEPSNALSLATWVIHVSSLVEWLIAMGLAWEYAEVVNRPAWKGLTWGMVPGHASGIAACTFHLFYNSPALNSVVAMQALLTVIGNSTCALAAYRISQEGERMRSETADVDVTRRLVVNEDTVEISMGSESLKGWEDLSATWAADSDAVLLLKLALVSTAVSALVKWGSLTVDFPFEPSIALAFSIIFIPTLLNCAKWAQLSQVSTDDSA